MKNPKTSDFVRATLAGALAVTLSLSGTSVVTAQNPPPPPTPPGLPTQSEQVDSQSVSVGSYRLVVSKDIVVTTLGNGVVQLQRGQVTAHIAALPQTGAASAAERLPAVIRGWNTDQPLSPIGQVIPGDRKVAGGTMATQRYQQNTADGTIHGLFLVQIGSSPTPEAFVVDVFSSGAADGARDWESLTQFASVVMSSVSLKRPW